MKIPPASLVLLASFLTLAGQEATPKGDVEISPPLMINARDEAAAEAKPPIDFRILDKRAIQMHVKWIRFCRCQ